MDVVLTGTGSPLPDANRAGPSTLVMADTTHLLIDAGRGVTMRMTAAGTLPAFLAGVFITHLHSDHICALNDVITTHWVMTMGQTPLRIFGPPGIDESVRRQLHMLEHDIGYRLEHHDDLIVGPQVEVMELEPGAELTIGDVSVTAEPTVHAPVHPTLGYRFEHHGAAAAIVGDTIPCAGVDALAGNADAYVQTVLREELVAQIPNPLAVDILDYHSTVAQAAQTAARVGAKRLVLTHMVPAPTPEQYPEWVAVAAAHYGGEIIIGDDLTRITI